MVNKTNRNKFSYFKRELETLAKKLENFTYIVNKRKIPMYKRIITIIDEIIENCNNYKYFDLKIILDKYEIEYDFVLDRMIELNSEAEEHFEYQISKYLTSTKELSKIDVSSFLLNIKEFPELYEEMINVLTESFSDYNKENLITINGYNINTIMEKEHIKLYKAYIYMINLAQGFEYNLITESI